MYRSIMVPLDGSRFGEEAVAVAVGLALKGAETLHLVTVLDTTGPDVVGWKREANDHDKAKAAAQAYLNGVAERVTENTDALEVTITVLPPDRPARALAEHLKATQAGLVVMTSHGRGPLSRVWLGSTTDRLLRNASRPILVVRPSEDGAAEIREAPYPIGHVLLPLDGSEEAEKAIEHALELIDQGARVTLLGGLSPYVPGAYPYVPRVEGQKEKRDRAHEELRSYLERKAEELRGRGFDVKVRTPVAQQPAAQILEEAEKAAVDLIAMATARKPGGFREGLGSVADKVVRGADCPVLVVRRTDDETPAR